MFSSLKNFVSRHKKKFIVTGIVVGGTVLAVRFAQRKIREFQETQAADLIEKARRTCHFESTEQTCNQTVMNLAPNLCEIVINLCDTESILEQIKKNPENKYELWDELKIVSFARITTLVYASSMLVVTLRVQLNLLGGYLYKDTITAEEKISNELQQAYLSLIEFYLKDGVFELYKIILKNVRTILKNYNLKQKLTLADTEQIFWSIQMAINSDAKDPNNSLSKFVFPDRSHGNQQLQKMFDESLDILESDEISNLCTNNISRGFSQVIDCLADFYTNPIAKKNGIVELNDIDNNQQPSTSKADLNQIFNVTEVEIPLPKLIPIINGLGSKAFSSSSRPPSLSTSLFTLYLLSDKIKTLGANVYEVFSQ